MGIFLHKHGLKLGGAQGGSNHWPDYTLYFEEVPGRPCLLHLSSAAIDDQMYIVDWEHFLLGE